MTVLYWVKPSCHFLGISLESNGNMYSYEMTDAVKEVLLRQK